ncbi:MAG TPA: multicopper oxidase domain-containing protein [Candidatus Bathyarchaeia archaeon]|nr:multicopper oxidase domain-containing protein [Candidatus Bathyarchaeia archaeon]
MKHLMTKLAMAGLILLAVTAGAHAMIDGVTGPDFIFTAKSDYISTPEGGRLFIWGYANGSDRAQYPGPTMLVNEGQTVTVTLNNALDVPVSILFPGQTGVTATEVAAPSQPGLLTLEAGAAVDATPGGTVQYSFVASQPGTYLYHSGTEPELQTHMGLVGALIVYPTAGTGTVVPNQAYNHPDAAYTDETLFLETEMDPRINYAIETGHPEQVDINGFFPVVWFLNGRCAPDTMEKAMVPWLPTQPYNCMPMMHPGDKVLMRVIGGGRDLHPLHHHGNNATVIARDGRMLASSPTSGPDLSVSVYTIQTVPGGTADAIFEWTGANLGWDIYGHQPGDPLEPNEYAPDHGKPLPVIMPGPQDLAAGPTWNGSPFLGHMGLLPPGSASHNYGAGYYHMIHSHTEKEMVNNDVFPGGMMTMVLILPPDVPFPDMMAMKKP